MRLVGFVMLVMLGACWRGSATAEPTQPTFIARKNALVELRRNVDALSPRLDFVVRGIIGLASEAERDAIRQDLLDLERDIAELSRYAVAARARGDSSTLLEAIEHGLERAALAIVTLRDELRYAKTTAELDALDELSRKEEEDRLEDRRVIILRRMRLEQVTPATELIVEPERTRRSRSVRIESP